MIIFCGSQAQISAKKRGFAPNFSSDIRSAAGELFTEPHQSLPEMSDGPMAIGEHCKMTSVLYILQHLESQIESFLANLSYIGVFELCSGSVGRALDWQLWVACLSHCVV